MHERAKQGKSIMSTKIFPVSKKARQNDGRKSSEAINSIYSMETFVQLILCKQQISLNDILMENSSE